MEMRVERVTKLPLVLAHRARSEGAGYPLLLKHCNG